MKRRTFLKVSAASAVGPVIVPAAVLGKAQQPPNERIQIGCIGLGSQGIGDMQAFFPFSEARIGRMRRGQ